MSKPLLPKDMVDLRDVFHRAEIPGQFRVWIKRKVIPALGRANVIAYDKYQGYINVPSAQLRENNYYAALTSLVIHSVFLRIDLNKLGIMKASGREVQASKLRAKVQAYGRAATKTQLGEQRVSTEPSFLASEVAPIRAPVVEKECIINATTRVPANFKHRHTMTISEHGFSNNFMYEPSGFGNQMRRTKLYNYWWTNIIDKLPKRAPKWFSGRKPTRISLHFAHIPGFDALNLTKSAIDVLSARWNFNDQIVVASNVTSEIVPEISKRKNDSSKSKYGNGFITFVIEQ